MTMSEPERKRQKTTVDDIVGLELSDAGRVFNIPLSTLRNAGGYFAARFGGSGIPPGSERMDERGRRLYFIPRDTDLFKNHILPFLSTNRVGRLPPFSQDAFLWRQVREEAVFYGLDSLSDMLHVTHECKADDPLGRGVLYWLGTGKGEHEYKNPYSIGAVDVGGWVDMTREELEAIGGTWPLPIVGYPAIHGANIASRQALVQYRPSVCGINETERTKMFCAKERCWMFSCLSVLSRNPVIVDLREIRLCPTAYSFRYDRCGMSHWNFEASVDGTAWDVLHKARDDPHLREPTEEDLGKISSANDLTDTLLLSYAEQKLRHTWELQSDTFYRYFRFIGIGDDRDPNLDLQNNRCMHGVGLELFGSVHEE